MEFVLSLRKHFKGVTGEIRCSLNLYQGNFLEIISDQQQQQQKKPELLPLEKMLTFANFIDQF